jgi:hypothetical protein
MGYCNLKVSNLQGGHYKHICCKPFYILLVFLLNILIPRNSRRAVNRRARQNKAPIPRLPQISTSLNLKHTFRFIFSGFASVTRANLLSLYALCLGGTSFSGLIASIKVLRIDMFSAVDFSTSSNTTATIGLLWKGGLGRDVFVSDTSTSSAYPARISMRPPKETAASFWTSIDNSTLSEVLFICNPSSEEEGNFSGTGYMDLVTDIVLVNQENYAISSHNSYSAGGIYYGYLDGPGGSTNYIPVGGIQYQ